MLTLSTRKDNYQTTNHNPKKLRCTETKQNKIKNKDNVPKKIFIFVLWANFMQLQAILHVQ